MIFKKKKETIEKSVVQQSDVIHTEPVMVANNDYTRYSREKEINVIPKEDFTRLVQDTFSALTNTLRGTYGPYGSTMVIQTSSNDTIATKDGWNIYNALNEKNPYKRIVYLAIRKICDRVNKTVGDGTTSCILLAEKLFNHIQDVIETPDDQRKVLQILSLIEDKLNNDDDIEYDKKEGFISSLNNKSLCNIITLASNYDEELTEFLTNAFDPSYDKNGNIISIKNVIPESAYDGGNSFNVNRFSIRELPGNYRVRVSIDPEHGRRYVNPSKVKILLFDHLFSSADWEKFLQTYDGESRVIMLARMYDTHFIENEYQRYAQRWCMAHHNEGFPITLGRVEGTYVRDEIRDLSAVANIPLIGISTEYSFNEIPEIEILMDESAMCFNIKDIPEDYIKNLEFEMNADTSGSHGVKQSYLDRINALSLKNNDVVIKINAPSALESKMLEDKVDDCIAIVNSALKNGVVPNLFVYGNYRVNKLKSDINDDLTNNILDSISRSIEGLFEDIYVSKYGNRYTDKIVQLFDNTKELLYNHKSFRSFDIVNENFCDKTELPTSSQYDIEVIVAAISIVKYLITSNSLIFDAFMIPNQ